MRSSSLLSFCWPIALYYFVVASYYFVGVYCKNIVLTAADSEREGTMEYLRNKAEGTEMIDLKPGQTVTVELKR